MISLPPVGGEGGSHRVMRAGEGSTLWRSADAKLLIQAYSRNAACYKLSAHRGQLFSLRHALRGGDWVAAHHFSQDIYRSRAATNKGVPSPGYWDNVQSS